MDRRRTDEDVPKILRDAYETASDIVEPSDLALTKTIQELRERHLLGSGGTRRPGPRWTAGWMRGWSVAVLVCLAFLGGYSLGSDGAPTAEIRHDVPAVVEDPARGAELVQEIGTTYVLALESLVNSLDRANSVEISTAREVLRSTTAAQSEPVRRLLMSNGPVPDTSGDRSIVWF